MDIKAARREVEAECERATKLRQSLWAAGYRPIAIITPEPHLEGRVPGKGDYKRPEGDEWQLRARQNPPEAAIRPATESALNSGILCDGLQAVDIDIDDPMLASMIRAVAEKELGAAPARGRPNSGRLILLYRAAEGEPPKIKISGVADGQEVAVEVLGRGNQFVAAGRHRTGAGYEWEGKRLPPRDQLTAVTVRQVVDFLQAVIKLVPGMAFESSRAQTDDSLGAQTGTGDRTRHDQYTDDLDGLADIVERMPNPQAWGRNAMLCMARSLIVAFANDPQRGRDLFCTWERRWEGNVTPGCAEEFYEKTARDNDQLGFGAWWILETASQNGVDIRSYANAQAQQEFEALEDAPLGQVGGRRGAGLEPIKVVAGQIDLIATRAEEALIAAGEPVYQCGGSMLVRPGWHDALNADGKSIRVPGIVSVTTAALVDHMSQAVEWIKFDGRSEKDVPCDPPNRVADVILSRAGRWSLPLLSGVIAAPTLRPDGSVLWEDGYDAATGLFHIRDISLQGDFTAEATRAAAEEALALLDGLLDGFPFVAQVDRSVALSVLLTAILRPGMNVAPLHAIRGTAPSSGKSYLVDVAAMLATGRNAPVVSVSSKDDETEKRIGGLLLDGSPIVSMDNCNGELGSDLLCQAVERTMLKLRPLGTSAMMTIDSRAAWFATGNGLTIRGDMTRRTILVRLDPGVEKPEEREHAFSPTERIAADRGKYVAAALMVSRAYRASGQRLPLKPLASYGAWSLAVREPLVWLGYADPTKSMEDIRGDDPDLTNLGAMLELWIACNGEGGKSTVRKVIDWANSYDESNALPADGVFADTLSRVAGVGGRVDPRVLGNWITGKAGRVVHGHKFERDGTLGGSAVWRVVPVAGEG